MDQVVMRVSVLKGECQGRIRHRFQLKVQLEDESQDNLAKLHWERGFLAGLDAAQQAANEIQRGEELERKRQQGMFMPEGIIQDNHQYSAGETDYQALGELMGNPHRSPEVRDATIVAQNVPVKEL